MQDQSQIQPGTDTSPYGGETDEDPQFYNDERRSYWSKYYLFECVYDLDIK